MAQARVRMPYAERRKQILREATHVVGTLGYNGFTLNDVAERCGMSVAGMLHYFPSKTDLVLALLGERDRNDFAAIAHAYGIKEEQLTDGSIDFSLNQRLDLLRLLVIRNSTQPDIVRLYCLLRTESMWEGHPAHTYFHQRDRVVLKTFCSWFEENVSHPESFARQLLALMGGLEEQWLLNPGSMDLVEEWDRAVEALVPSWKPSDDTSSCDARR